MELTLARQAGSQVLVTCDNKPSHTFDLLTLTPHETGLPQQLLDDSIAYGQVLYAALFPPETIAQHVLAIMPERILLITTDNDLDAIPWEYTYGPDGFLVLECHFVRGLPPEQRISPPTLDSGLHIVAIPSNPLSQAVESLNIEGEWTRLKEIIQQVPYAITLERTRPPTIEQVRTLLANQRHRVIHFMGHGGQDERGALLYFEQENGELDPVTAKQFVLRVRGSVFLVTLNACASAAPATTPFGNLAAALVRQKTPYALGMRFSIDDEDARAFSRVFYNDLAHGSSVEEALLQVRLSLAKSFHRWVVGVPVLYTSLTQPSAGFASLAGSSIIKEHQSHIEVNVLLRTEGAFQGRIDELKALGTVLTSDSRPPLVTIQGVGGQGKTALAREAVERFAHAWPGGVLATSLENLPSRELFVNDLARFLGIDTQKVIDADCAEHIRQALEAKNYTTWREPTSLTMESILYPRTIENVILGRAAVVLVWSSSATQSEWIERHILFAQQLKKTIVPVVIDGTGLPTTLIVSTTIISQTSCTDVAAQLLPHLPPPDSTDPLIVLSEKAAHEFIRIRKEAIDQAADMLKRGEHREAVLAILEYLAHNDLMMGVREKAQEVLDADAKKATAPAFRPEDSRHIIGMRCKNGHITYFDKRRICLDKETIVRSVQRAGLDLDERDLTCGQCGEAIKVHVDCRGYR